MRHFPPRAASPKTETACSTHAARNQSSSSFTKVPQDSIAWVRDGRSQGDASPGLNDMPTVRSRTKSYM